MTLTDDQMGAWFDKLEQLEEPKRSQMLVWVKQEFAREKSLKAHGNAAELAASLDPAWKITPGNRLVAEAIEETIHTRRGRLLITMGPQEGKLVADSVPVPTPDGWRKHGDLAVGDWVFHPSGRPIRVAAVHPKYEASLLVKTSDHAEIKVHPRHEWTVFDSSRNRWRTVETQELQRQLTRRVGEYRYHLPLRECLQLPDADLPIDPYMLGLWLGDGSSAAPRITHHPNDVYEVPYPATSHATHQVTGIVTTYYGGGLRAALREAGLLGNKHIPAAYLRGSETQRRALLAGLIDTDGHVHTSGQVSFDNANEQLVREAAELIRTLGYRAHVHKPTAAKQSSSGVQGVQEMWRVTFTTHDGVEPARLERKRRTRKTVRRRPAITSITEVEPEQGNCITVDADDGMYLVGEHLTPTHNTSLAAIWGVIRALQWHPEWRCMLASFSSILAEESSVAARNLIAKHGSDAVDPLTQIAGEDELGLALAYDKASAAAWRLRGHRGGLVAIGLGGTISGRPADLLIIDDPIKGMEAADSATTKRHVIEGFQGDLTTRLAPGAPVILIQTRWAVDDLAGWILSAESKRPASQRRWRHVNIPALSEEGLLDSLGREHGVWLESARGRTARDWEETRDTVGSRVWAALYQGSPSPLAGGLIKKQWLNGHRLTLAPTNPVLTVVGVDPAESGKGDEAGLVAACLTTDGNIVMIADKSAQMTSDEWVKASVNLAVEVGASRIVVEAFSAGTTYKRLLEEEVERSAPHTDIEVVPWPPNGSKRGGGDSHTRSTTLLAQLENGRTRLAGHFPAWEARATGWQVGQHQPDGLSALVVAHDELIHAGGLEWDIALPFEPRSEVDLNDWMTRSLR